MLAQQARLTRRGFLAGTALATLGHPLSPARAEPKPGKASIALTLDLEMSRHYPRRGIFEWDFQKGNLDEATKQYALKAARIAHDRGAVIHFFCVGRVLEQPDVGFWGPVDPPHRFVAGPRLPSRFHILRCPTIPDGPVGADMVRSRSTIHYPIEPHIT